MCVFPCAEDVEDDAGYLDVAVSEVKQPPAQLSPMPEGLSSQQVCMCVYRCLHLCVCVRVFCEHLNSCDMQAMMQTFFFRLATLTR